ncbi:hypothetical protein DSO57_1027751 [Entomophthora muscae]|uniref:Uncharacterized protein n=1 Tax=Entomophthora muscae TaxID=34485 RepID=A0ACC2UMH0_9FUNG|nr:hypothetical protein DSO57_1027751 [Entomophthora muscae]
MDGAIMVGIVCKRKDKKKHPVQKEVLKNPGGLDQAIDNKWVGAKHAKAPSEPLIGPHKTSNVRSESLGSKLMMKENPDIKPTKQAIWHFLIPKFIHDIAHLSAASGDFLTEVEPHHIITVPDINISCKTTRTTVVV